MYNRQFFSLTGDTAYQYFPQQTEVLTTNSSPVSNTVVRGFLRIDDNIDETYIDDLISGVTEQVENYINKDVRLKVRRSFWSRPKQTIALPYNPVSVINVVSVDGEGTQTNVTGYNTSGLTPKNLTFNTTVQSVIVTHSTGYSVCPDAIKSAIIQEVAVQYKNRQDPSQPERVSVNNLSLEARHLLIGGGFYDYSR